MGEMGDLGSANSAGQGCVFRMTGLGFTYNGQFRRLPGWMTWLLRRFLQIPLSRLLRGTTFGVQVCPAG